MAIVESLTTKSEIIKMFNKQSSYSLLSKRPKKKSVLILMISLMGFSQSFAQYEMRKHTINSGGTNMSGGTYELKSSLGQVDASNTMSLGIYQLTGGFWHENNDLIFKNGFE